MTRPCELVRAERGKMARAKYFRNGMLPFGDVASQIWRSWNRCSDAGQDPSRPIGFDMVSRGREREIAERNRVLTEAARSEMDRLASVVAGTKLIALLSGEFGTVVDTMGEITGESSRLKLAARRGVDLSEGAVGTNAVGTALIEQAVVATVAHEHYFDV